LKDNLVLEFTKLGVLRVPPIQISTQNEKIKILFSEFHPRTNLTALLSSILVSKNKQVLKGTLVKGFEISSWNGFHGLKMVLSCLEGTIELEKVLPDLS
jgi:hypothetical protein